MIDQIKYQAMETRLRRKAGVSPTHKIEMDNFLKAQADWYIKCKTCGEKIEGLPQDIKAHAVKCNEASK